MSYLRWKHLSAALLVVALGACDAEVPTSVEETQTIETTAAEVVESTTFLSAGGHAVTRKQVETTMRSLARATAMALGRNAGLRGQIRGEINSSKFRENKVEFTRLANRPDLSLLREIGKGLGEKPGVDPKARGLAALDSVVALEFYMPVPGHRVAWSGNDDFLVATAVDDGPDDAIFAFNARGEAVEVSMKEPPKVPTLVLVPVETDFSEAGIIKSDPGTSASADGPAMTPPSDPPGWYLTKSYLTDLHESWIRGEPEIEFHLFRVNPLTYITESYFCGGEQQLDPWKFKQENHLWTGPATMATTDAQWATSTYFIYHIWENDFDPCREGNNHPPKKDYDSGWQNKLISLSTAIFSAAGGPPDNTWQWLATSIGVAQSGISLAGALLGEDDFVGATNQLATGACYSEASGPVLYQLRDEDNHYAGYLEIEENFGERVLCPMEAEILGPTSIEVCNGFPDPDPDFSSQVTGGSGTTTYKWFENNVLRGTSSQYTLYQTSEGTTQLRLEVTRGTQTDIDYHNVQITELEGEGDDCSGGGGGIRPDAPVS